ncbi:MAG: hypothetical protein ABID45_03530 [Patescibacteria group bacterium]
MNFRNPVLSTISWLFQAFGKFTIAMAILGFLGGLFAIVGVVAWAIIVESFGMEHAIGLGVGILVSTCSLFSVLPGLLTMAIGEIFGVIFDIEKNTRETANLLRKATGQAGAGVVSEDLESHNSTSIDFTQFLGFD